MQGCGPAVNSHIMTEKVVKVGFGQLNNPTPMAFKYAFRTLTFFAGLWALVAPSLTHMTEDTMAEVNKWLLVGVAAMHYAIKFFGWDYKTD